MACRWHIKWFMMVCSFIAYDDLTVELSSRRQANGPPEGAMTCPKVIKNEKNKIHKKK